MNGLCQANKILREDVFRTEDWKVIGEYVYDAQGGRHQAFYSPLCDVDYKDIHFKAGERVQVEQSLKYSTEEAVNLWRTSGLREVRHWSASSDTYSEWSCRLSYLLFPPCRSRLIKVDSKTKLRLQCRHTLKSWPHDPASWEYRLVSCGVHRCSRFARRTGREWLLCLMRIM